MTAFEFDSWLEFYRNFPFDDLHRYHRPAALVAQSMCGGDIKDKLAWLAPEPLPEGMSLADVNTLRAFGYMPESKGAE